MFDGAALNLPAVSGVFGVPLGWPAWHRGHMGRAKWVWATTLVGAGLPAGVWAALTTRQPLVPWMCPSCGALTAPERSHVVATATGISLCDPGSGSE